jgi:hypothetical protein
VRDKSSKRVRGGARGAPARRDPRRLLEAESGLVGRITTYLLSRYRLAPGESRALRRLIRARLAADDYKLLQSFDGRSSFGTYLVVVIVRLVRELTAGWGLQAAGAGADEPAVEPLPRPALGVALAFLRGLPPRDHILLRLRFGEQLPLTNLRAPLALDQAALRRRLGELRRTLLRELTESGCEDRHTASLLAAATRLNSCADGEAAASRPSNAVGELDVDEDAIPS